MNTPENAIVGEGNRFTVLTQDGATTLLFGEAHLRDEDLLKILIRRAEHTTQDLQYLADLTSALGGVYVRRDNP